MAHNYMYGPRTAPARAVGEFWPSKPGGQATPDASDASATPGVLSTTQTVEFNGKPYVLGFGAGAALGLVVGWLVFKK
jgi:hypothetical protein